MSLDTEGLRALLASREGTRLDFKAMDYDWAKGKDAKVEMVKDVMAMANALSPGDAHAYILIGVDEKPDDRTGVVVGVHPAAHVGDADLHQKVAHALNRTPDFTYSVMEIDAKSVGIYEIRWARRPFFPIRDQGDRNKLHRRVALVRDGSSTDVASPDEIGVWARQRPWWRQHFGTKCSTTRARDWAGKGSSR